MNNKGTKLSFLARTAMTLFLAVLGSTGAWADKTYTAGESYTSDTWGTETVIVQGSGSVTFVDRITISGSTTLKVAAGTTLVAEGGIDVGYGNTLTIEGSGTINATGKNYDAAIGGKRTYSTCGTIIINGCTITANGGTNAAGIGCAEGGTGGSVTINGGTVTAQSSGSNTGGAGIGSGRYGSINDITINGGTVTATPRPYSAGIGGGQYGGCSTINIYGGIVKSENHDGVYPYYSFGPGKDYSGSSTCTVTFGWTNSTDKIEGCQFSSNNNKTLVFVKGKQFIKDNNIYSVVETAANFSYYSDFTLTPRIVDAEHDIANAVLTGHSTYTENNFVYKNGSDIPYGVEIDGTALTAGTDYTVDKLTCNGTAVEALNAKGDYELTILGTGDYCGIKTFKFTVNSEVILSSDNKVTNWVGGTTYIANTWVPMYSEGDITVTGNVHLLLLGTNAELSTSSIIVSEGNTLTISGNGYLEFTLNSNKVVLGNDNGNCGTIIINGGNINCLSSSYDGLIGSNNTDAGTVEINGGVVQARQIRCKNINYNGGQVTISKRINAGYGYIACTNLTLGWTDAQNDFIQAIGYSPTNLAFVSGKAFMVDGEYTTVTASNINSLGTKKLVPKRTDMSRDIAYAIISDIDATYEYTGSAIDISGYTVTDTNDNILLRDFDYTAALTLGGTAVSEVKDAGDYALTVTGQNGYTGEKSVNFTVAVSAPTSLKQTAYTATTATLSWTETSTPTNWTLEYSTDNTFETGVTSVDVTSNPVTLTGLAKETTYYARVKIVSGSVESDWSNTAEFGTTAKRWIGYDKDDSETNYVILNSYYKCNISEQIYLQSEIGGAGVIRSIDFFVTKNGGQTRNIDIYMVHTPNNYFNSNKAWINPTSTNLVFSGNVTFANGWNTITLTTPFEYNGNQNLAVIVNDKTESSSVNIITNALYFRILNDNDNMCISGLSATPYDPSTISTTGSQRKIRNEIRLGIDESVSIAMNGLGIMTYASPFALDFTDVDGLTATYASAFNTNNDNTGTLTLTTAGQVPAGEGLMLKGTANETYNVPIIASAAALSPANKLVGLTKATAVSKKQTIGNDEYTTFILAKNNNVINWYVLDESSYTLKAHSAYLRLLTTDVYGSNGNARQIIMGYNDVTGIATVSAEEEINSSLFTLHSSLSGWYTLDGVKLNGKPTRKGLYIMNGRKAVIR